MASNAEFRRVVNYADLERFLECKFLQRSHFIAMRIPPFSLGPLCLDRFDQPRSLHHRSSPNQRSFLLLGLIPCGHTYCTKCLNELSSGNDTIICPQCREEHRVPSGGIQRFPRNLSYQQLLDIRTEQLVSTRQCQVRDLPLSILSAIRYR